MAFSMGGYYAPRAAAFEKRFAAGVAWGAHFDYHANWIERRKVQESGGTKLSAPHFQLPWVMGMPDMDSSMKKLEKYTLRRRCRENRMPVPGYAGRTRFAVAAETGQLLYKTIGSKVKKYKVFTKEEGGAEHCQGDNRQFGSNYVADWLADILKATPPSQFNLAT